MKIYIYYIFVLTNAVTVINVMGKMTDDYYWKDYVGIIPKDALPGGIERAGRPMYIAQALFEDKLIPGKVFTHENYMHFGWFNEKKATENVKVLCTRYPHKFEWVQTKLNEVVSLSNKLKLKGGFQPGYTTYIGRIFTAGETSIGKIICTKNDCVGFYTTRNEKEIHHTNLNLEILTYNADAEAVVSVDPCLYVIPRTDSEHL